MTRPDRARPRRQRLVLGAVVVSLVAATLGTAAIATDAFGAGDRWESLVGRVERFIAGPVPDRATRATVRVTDPPVDPTDTPEPTTRPTTAPARGVTGSAAPTAAPDPTATPTPKPKRVPVDIDVVPEHDKVFASELRKDWCAPAGVADGPRPLRPRRHRRRRAAPDRQPGGGVGGAVGQHQRRMGTRGDGPGPRGVRRAGLRGPRLRVAQLVRCATPPARSCGPARR